MTEARQTFFWYDLETSGTNPREDRIMQFAGQRTTLDLEPVGDPVNILIRLTDEVLPAPDAILITGITPQSTHVDGITEAEFLKIFTNEVAVPGTIFVGYNTVRFDDEFMRFLHFRNYYDPYSWQWRDNRSRWDLLDVVRMTRALRPGGIKWPVVDGKPTNRLELLTKSNGINHESAHDALSDVNACISVAKLIRSKHSKLFDYLLSLRSKQAVAEVVRDGKPFVYSSGKYPSEFEKTSVVTLFSDHPSGQGVLVYDLRHDPKPFLGLSPEELAGRWQYTREDKAPPRLPIKTLQFNRCPAVAPLSVLDKDSQERIGIDVKQITLHADTLRSDDGFKDRVIEALRLLDESREQRWSSLPNQEAEASLYGSFIGDSDNTKMRAFRVAKPEDLIELGEEFSDARLREMTMRYKARNYPSFLTDEERAEWESYRYHRLMDGGTKSRLAGFMHRLSELSLQRTDADSQYLLQELHLYAESIMPVAD